MVFSFFSTNETDVSLNGRECKPDIAASFNGISAARSHGVRYRHSHNGLDTIPERKEGEPPKESIPQTMPSGDVIYAATGIGNANFTDIAAKDWMKGLINNIGTEASSKKGAATMGLVVKSSDSIRLHRAGDCIISIIGRDENGKPCVAQLTIDEINTGILPNKGAIKGEDGKYKPEDTRIAAEPFTYIGHDQTHFIEDDADTEKTKLVQLDYDKIRKQYGEDAIIMVSTDGFYDRVAHPPFEYHKDKATQDTYVAQLKTKMAERHESFLLQAVEELAEKGYSPTHPDYAALLARYARTHIAQPKEGAHGSYDDIGIVCISASKPKSPEEHAIIAAFDAMGNDGIEGIKTARAAIKTLEESVVKMNLSHKEPVRVHAHDFKHDNVVEAMVNCQLKYRQIQIQNQAPTDRIIFEFDEPKFIPTMRSVYQAYLNQISSLFGAQIINTPYETQDSKGQIQNKTKVQITLGTDKLGNVAPLAEFLQKPLFWSILMKADIKHDGSINQLAASDFTKTVLDTDATQRLQELLQKTGEQTR